MKRNAIRILQLCTLAGVALCFGHGGRCLAGEEGEDQAELDIIRRNDGARDTQTQIAKDDIMSVEGRFKGVVAKVPSYAIKEVLYLASDDNYRAAVQRRKEGKYTLAARLFKDALDALRDKPWSAEYCNWGMGEALFEDGKYKGYVGKAYTYEPPSHYFRLVIKANPKSRFLLDASVKLAINLAEEGKFSEADAAFKEADATISKFRNDATKWDNGPAYLKMADRAQALMALGHARLKERIEDGKPERERDYEPALGAYKTASTKATGKFPLIYAECVDGELKVMFKKGEFDAALDRAQEIINRFKETSDTNLLGMLPGAYSVIGKANLAKALKAGQPLQANKLYAEARWNLLHVIVQFFDNDEYVAEANYLAGVCCDNLSIPKVQDLKPNEIEDAQAKGYEKDAAEKAIQHWTTVVRDFPKSKFEELAQKELTRVGANAKPAPEKAPAEKGAAEKTAPEKATAGKTESDKPAAKSAP